MRKYSPFSLCLLFTSLLYTSYAGADYACLYDLRLGVVTGNKHVRTLNATRTAVQINHPHNQPVQLFVEGRMQTLSTEQRELVAEYNSKLNMVVPEITLLAREGVGLVTDNLARIYTGLVGQNSNNLPQIQESMGRVKKGVREKFGQAGDYYFINPGKMEMEDEIISETLQAQIESGFSNIGGILTAIATFDTREEEESTAQTQLQKRAKKTCGKLKYIDRLESEIHAEIPSMKRYDLVVRQSPSRKR